MNIEKIISGGRPGAERAALDAAIKLGLGYGGWMPKENVDSVGMNADRYNLIEMPTANRNEILKKNIREADGTLLLSHGTSSRDLENMTRTIHRYSKPMLHVDLIHTNAFNAASLINDWIMDNRLTILHVTGPSEKEDLKIHAATMDILQAVFFLNLTETNLNQTMGAHGLPVLSLKTDLPPGDVDTAVDIIIHEMHLKDRILMANLRKEELASLQMTLGLYIQRKLDIWLQDATLYASCVAAAEEEKLDKSNMPMVLIKIMWKKLRDTHRLRIVK